MFNFAIIFVFLFLAMRMAPLSLTAGQLFLVCVVKHSVTFLREPA